MSEREEVRTRVQEAEPLETNYDRTVREMELRNKKRAEGQIVIKGKNRPWELTRQGRLRNFVTGRREEELAAPGWTTFQHEIRKHSGMHRHQGGNHIFVLAGKGYTLVEGVRHDWEAGDLVMLPILPGGVAHQHFNLDPATPAVWMNMVYGPLKEPLANWHEQLELSPEWADKKGIKDRKVAPIVNRARTTGADDSPRDDSLFDALLRARDQRREEVKHARAVIKGKTLPLETNRMGLFRWYLHPRMRDTVCRSQIMYVQEIPGGSRSGKQLHQGGRIHFVLEGKGSTVIDGVRHDWEAEDIILLPLKSYGVIHQHLNSDPAKPVRLLVAEPNWVDTIGVDMGSGFEMLESAPEYAAKGAVR